MMWTWTTVLDVLCTLLPIATFAAPATVFLPVLRSDSGAGAARAAVEMPPLALTAQMLQCFLFAVYARHLHMRTLFVPNAAGFALGLAWSTVYPCVASPAHGLRSQWRMQYAAAWTLMLLGASTVRRWPHVSSAIAAAVGTLMCTYPLPSMRRAYRERNAAVMGSAAMNAAMFATCSVWVVHSSLLEYDGFVLVANACGVIVQGSALALRVVITKRARGAPGESAESSALTPLLADSP